MTLDDIIRKIAEDVTKSAKIVSPRFEDYEITNFQGSASNELGLEEMINSLIEARIKEELPKLQEEERREEIAQTPNPPGSTVGQATLAAKKGIGAFQNPAQVASELMKFLPHTALIALAISLVPLILKELVKPGGVMDVRWKREMQNEQNAFLDRQTQRDTQTGNRQIIISTHSGFRHINPALNYNNLRDIREGGVDGTRLAQIGLPELSKGMSFP